MLDRQKLAQSQRQKILSLKDGHATASRMDQLIAFLEREYEVMTSLVDAEISLTQLLEDRGIISVRIDELRRSMKTCKPSVEQELASLQEELEMRNAQISDMQQKIYATDLETYICSVGDNIHSMMEARVAMKHIWKTALDIRREKVHSMEDLKTQLNTAEEKCIELTKSIETLKLAHQHAIQEYEEKIALILRPRKEQTSKLRESKQDTISRYPNLEKTELLHSKIKNNKVRLFIYILYISAIHLLNYIIFLGYRGKL